MNIFNAIHYYEVSFYWIRPCVSQRPVLRLAEFLPHSCYLRSVWDAMDLFTLFIPHLAPQQGLKAAPLFYYLPFYPHWSPIVGLRQLASSAGSHPHCKGLQALPLGLGPGPTEEWPWFAQGPRIFKTTPSVSPYRQRVRKRKETVTQFRHHVEPGFRKFRYGFAYYLNWKSRVTAITSVSKPSTWGKQKWMYEPANSEDGKGKQKSSSEVCFHIACFRTSHSLSSKLPLFLFETQQFCSRAGEVYPLTCLGFSWSQYFAAPKKPIYSFWCY